MRSYETTFILAPTLDEDGVKNEIENVKKAIASQGGEITAEKEWGKRRLAYPLRDHSEGVYHILRFSLEAKGLGELDRFFRLNENVLRSLVIRDEGTPLEYVGQASEYEERDRDFRDRRPDFRSGRSGPGRDGPGRDRPTSRPPSAPGAAAKEAAPAAAATEVAPAAAATEVAPVEPATKAAPAEPAASPTGTTEGEGNNE